MGIPIRKVFVVLVLFALGLLLMHLFGLLLVRHFPGSLSGDIFNRFNLNAEGNIPTWYSTVLLFLVSLCSLVIYLLRRNVIIRSGAWNSFWILLAFVYCFLSLDEASRLHELIDQHTSIKWVYIYGPFAAMVFVVTCVYLLMVRYDNRFIRIWIIGGLLVSAGGGLASELISFNFFPLPPVWQQIEFMMEEGLEMFGTIMVLMGCLHELNELLRTHSGASDWSKR